MKIPLTEFEKYVDKTMRQRGFDYFRNGCVVEFEEAATGMYQAVVAGTEDYHVRLTLKNGVVAEHVCDCPYDLGPVCKHVVAAMFYLRKHEGIDTKNPAAKPPGPQKSKQHKTAAEKVVETIANISHAQMREFVASEARRDRKFRERFLSTFAGHDEKDSKKFYEKKIKGLIRAASDRDGFVDRKEAARLRDNIDGLLNIAEQRMEEQNYASAINICTGVMEQMAEALQYADDSNGDIGACIAVAFDMFYKIAAARHSENVRQTLVKYCFDAYDKKVYDGWEWHMGMLDIASSQLKTEDELSVLLARTFEAQRSSWDREEAERITYNALLRIHGEGDAALYLGKHLDNPSLRRMAIGTALEEKRYEKAIMLAKDGIEQDRQDKPGLVNEWRDWLLKVAQSQRDRENIITNARWLCINNFNPQQDHYGLLKRHVSNEEWTEFVEDLIREIAAKNSWGSRDQIAAIYIREGWLDRLYELIKRSPTLPTLEKYESHLKKDYPDELGVMYARAVIDFLKNKLADRRNYKTACRYLRRIKKLGSPEKVNEIIEFLRAEYPQRRALHEELDLV